MPAIIKSRIMCKADSSGDCRRSKPASPLVKKRIEMLRSDVKSIYEQRRATLASMDSSVREIVLRESELRQELFDKWFAIAKEDIEHVLGARCKYVEESDENVKTEQAEEKEIVQPPAAEAFYEPWVKDD